MDVRVRAKIHTSKGLLGLGAFGKEVFLTLFGVH
jgi:hypothetical protein